jgi:tetratricopeptide (TPR) repeat protein
MSNLTLPLIVQAATALHATKQEAEAAEFWDVALELQPDDPIILTGAAVTRRALKEFDKAELLARRAVALAPNARRQTILGCAIHDQARFDEAEAMMRAARAADPNFADAAWILGIYLLEKWQFRDVGSDDALVEAIPHLEHACELAPQNIDAHIPLVSALIAADRLDEAIRRATDAIERLGHVGEFHLFRAAARMKLGKMVQGYQDFGKWAYKLTRVAHHPLNHRPRWEPGKVPQLPVASRQLKTGPGDSSFQQRTGNLETGGHLEPDNCVYVWNLEGAGDHFQFIRFAKAMAEDGWRVKAICNKTMDRLIARVPGVDSIITEGDAIEDDAIFAPVTQLPAEYIGTRPLWEGPYMTADRETRLMWAQRLDDACSGSPSSLIPHPSSLLRVGVCWRGNAEQSNDARRSFGFERFAPLAQLPGVELVSLQKGHAIDFGWKIVDLGDEYQRGDWLDTAGVIANLDLVIAPCTGVAHLAGAMGKPVWLALSEPCCWRWMKPDVPTSFLIPHPSSHRSPWYPSMSIFRQQKRGSWDGVFEAMASELSASAARAA